MRTSGGRLQSPNKYPNSDLSTRQLATKRPRRAIQSIPVSVDVNGSEPQASLAVVPTPVLGRVESTPAGNSVASDSGLSAAAEKWVQHKSRSMALALTIPSLTVPVLSSPTDEWWAAHPSAKIKHRVYNGSRAQALDMARKLHAQLLADPVKQPLLAQDSSALSGLLDLVADGRASPMHQFKLAQSIAPPRQFVPRLDGRQLDYSASSNREAITWFANNPLVSTSPSTSCAPPSTRAGGVKEGYRCIAGANPTPLPLPSTVYCIAACAASAPFDVRMSSDGITPPWVSEVANGLPTIHALWA